MRGVDVYIHVVLTAALVGGEWSASRSCRFTPTETVPGTHWVGGIIGPRARLDDTRSEDYLPYRNSNSYPSVIQPVASRYTYLTTAALWNK
jgi:hypothetical protein